MNKKMNLGNAQEFAHQVQSEYAKMLGNPQMRMTHVHVTPVSIMGGDAEVFHPGQFMVRVWARPIGYFPAEEDHTVFWDWVIADNNTQARNIGLAHVPSGYLVG